MWQRFCVNFFPKNSLRMNWFPPGHRTSIEKKSYLKSLCSTAKFKNEKTWLIYFCISGNLQKYFIFSFIGTNHKHFTKFFHFVNDIIRANSNLGSGNPFSKHKEYSKEVSENHNKTRHSHYLFNCPGQIFELV